MSSLTGGTPPGRPLPLDTLTTVAAVPPSGVDDLVVGPVERPLAVVTGTDVRGPDALERPADPEPGSVAPSPRLGWIDATRGACVVAVVLFHVCLWHLPLVQDSLWTPARDGWLLLNTYLGSVRMPVLLIISGVVAARVVRLPWRDPDVVRRVASSYYLYVVWLCVYAAFFAVSRSGRLPHRISGVAELAEQLVLPDTTLWYVAALAVYVPLLASVRRVPLPVVLAVLTAVSVATSVWGGEHQAWKVPGLMVYFAVGSAFADRWRTWARDASVPRAAGAGVLAFAALVSAKLNLPPALDGVPQVVRGVLVAAVVFLVVALLVRWAPAGRVGSYVGTRTLPVYVLHVPVLLLALEVTRQLDRGRPVPPALSVLYPLLLTAVVVAVTLLLHGLLQTVGAGALFAVPPRLLGAVVRVVSRTHRPAGTDVGRASVRRWRAGTPAVTLPE